MHLGFGDGIRRLQLFALFTSLLVTPQLKVRLEVWDHIITPSLSE
jgi:hypothetical protein